jgi:uncharacterized protein YsxB (DUF464 family)
MIRMLVRREAGRVISFRVSGHAGFADAGEDIVCAGVSAITQTALIGLTHYLPEEPRTDMREGFLEVILPPLDAVGQEKASLLLETMLLGLVSLRCAYPTHIQLDTQEV